MDILILNWKDIRHPQVGGAEIIAFEFAKRLVKDGHTVTFFSSNFPDGKDKEDIDGVTVIRKGNLFTVYFNAYLYYRSLKRKPDKVVEMINTVCWQTWLYIPSYKRIAYLNQLAKEVWFYQFPKIIGLIGYFFERIEYLPYRNAAFMCYSRSTKADLISYGITKSNIHLFSLGIDHARYKPGPAKSKDPLFVFVARLVNMKKPDLCIEAMQWVVKKFPEAKLAIVGNGLEEYRLQRLTASLELNDNVIFVNKNNFFLGKHVQDQKVALMQQAWALLLPSVKEGWGMVVTEAAACGTPAIVSNVSGLQDSVIDKKTGIILSKNPSAEELAEAIVKFIQDKAFRDQVSHGALAWSRNFTWEKSFQEFQQLLIHN